MRILALLLLCPFVAHAQAFDVTATMPTTANATSCQLYKDGVAVGSTKPCGVASLYPGLVPSPGVYRFKYKTVNAAGSSANFSPEVTWTVSAIPPPVDPTQPPTITIECNPAPCPANIVITLSP